MNKMRKGYKEIYRAVQLPVFQNRMFYTEDEAINCTKGDIVLVQDLETGLIFNQTFQPELMNYDTDYQNEQAVSNVFKQHLHNVSKIIQKHFHEISLIEVGCGKGYFLEQLKGLGFDIIGLDPTYEGTSSSVIKEYFTPEVGLKADGIILRHVLEHVQDPVTFLTNLLEANGGSGKIYIEVPCFNWISEHRAWFDIFYEHVNYFRLADFNRMFGKVYESGHVFGGQYLYVVADLATVREPILEQSDIFDFPIDFLSDIDRIASIINGKQNAIWGGASKGVIFALFMQRAEVNIDLVIDINPAKQNKYIAGSGVKVLSPNDGMQMLQEEDNVIVMNLNYLQEIVELSHNQFNYIQVENHEF